MARSMCKSIMMALNALCDSVGLMSLNGAQKNTSIMEMIDVALDAQAGTAKSGSIAAQAIGVIVAYETGPEVAGWLLGLWSPQGPDMLGAAIGADLGADIGALACIDTGQ